MRCRSCRGDAVIEIRRHHAAFCPEHFFTMFRTQVEKAIRRHQMMVPDDRILLAVSGGKDSLALWDVLLELGYQVTGLYLGLGIGDYSDRSHDVARAFADRRRARLLTVDLEREHGYDIPTAGRRGSRSTCAVCGLSKRYVFNRAAVEGGFDVVATGHNLDDEAAVLFGNVLHWHTEYLARQAPVLPARAGFPKKVKPLVRLGEREMAAYCVLRGIDYIVEECPMAAGNRHLRYKDALNEIEASSPGAKFDFFHGFLARAATHFELDEGDDAIGACTRCGAPCSTEVCAFCRLTEKATAPQPVHLGPSRRRA
jgi:tRNA-5-methyluridine54 2-sulfurtransferase